jgi:hypothetical protein
MVENTISTSASNVTAFRSWLIVSPKPTSLPSKCIVNEPDVAAPKEEPVKRITSSSEPVVPLDLNAPRTEIPSEPSANS